MKTVAINTYVYVLSFEESNIKLSFYAFSFLFEDTSFLTRDDKNVPLYSQKYLLLPSLQPSGTDFSVSEVGM